MQKEVEDCSFVEPAKIFEKWRKNMDVDMELHHKYMEMDMDNVMDMDVNMDDGQNLEF